MNLHPIPLRFFRIAFALLSFVLFCHVSFADEASTRTIVLSRVDHSLYSPVIELEKPYNSVIVRLDHPGSGIKVNFHPDNGGLWEPLSSADGTEGDSSLLFSSPSRSIQFLKDPQDGETTFRLEATFNYEAVLADGTSNMLSGPQTTSSGLKIISRAEWGADETLRFWSPESDQGVVAGKTETDTSSGTVDACKDYATKYPDEVATERTISYSPKGDVLSWPLTYAKSVKKIIVHHTDSDIRDLNGDLKTDGQDFAAMVRAIYRFHAVTRGWGDIGYNYLIDPLGNVYEGRYGGDKVIGAHAQCFNNGTIGISIIGNYQDNPVPQPALDSLVSLIALKSSQFNIDPQGTSSFRGKDLFNVLGHRDVRPTTCPGDQLYSLLPKIRERAAFILRSGSFSDTGNVIQTLDYNAESLSAVESLSLLPNERKTIVLRFQNTGNKTWDSNTWLHVDANDKDDARVVPLIPDKTYVAADMKENSVSPGQTATFEVEFEAGYFGANTTFEFSPVVNGRFKVSKAAVAIPVQVADPNFDYSVVKSSLPSGTVFQGQKIQASIQLQNSGNVTWVNYGPNAIMLGTEAVRDRKSLLATHSPTRLATLAQSTVKPGEIGTFQFDLEAPLKFEGSIVERFTPVIERVKWLQDKNLGFSVIVKQPIHLARVLEKTDISTIAPGEMKKVEITLENRGDLPWESDTMAIGMLAKELKVFKTEMIPSDIVYPNASETFSFWVQAPYKEADGSVFLNSKFRKIPIHGGTIRFQVHVPAPNLRAQKVDQSTPQVQMQPGEEKQMEVEFKNVGNAVWHNSGPNAVKLATSMPKDRASLLYYADSWESKSRAGKMVEKEVLPGQTGTFLFRVKPQAKGDYKESFQLVMENAGWIDASIVHWDFNVSGDKIIGSVDFKKDAKDNKANAAMITKAITVATQPTPVTQAAQIAPSLLSTDKPFRVRISYASDQSNITSDKGFKVTELGGKVLFELNAGSVAAVTRMGDNLHVQVGTEMKSAPLVRFLPYDNGIMEIQSMERRPTWNKDLNDNKFRGALEVRVINGSTAYIDELPLEDYVKGLAEVSNDTPFEKQKAIAVLARTYARYYMDETHRKFPGFPYDGSDDPDIFQRYLGYGVELRSPNFSSAVLATEGEVVTYKGKLIKTPYFNQSAGKTLSAQEVWGWTDTPYLQSVPDPYCVGLTLQGHGVGLSGCGAEGMAKAGKKYDEIIKYYFQGVDVEKMEF
jgi:hypothetical protein